MRKNVRKILFVLLIALTLMTLQVACAETEGDFTFALADGSATITGYTGAGGNVVVPETLGGYPVVSVGYSAFEGCASLTGISLPAGVTTIDDYAFVECVALKSVSIPAGVKSIGTGAFRGCTALEEVGLPTGLTKLNDLLFEGCSSLVKVTIPASVQELGMDVFADCTSLTGVTIPDGVKYIPADFFLRCGALTSVNIPDSVTSIGDYAFAGCTALENIKLPPLTGSVGYEAFRGCPGPAEVVLEEGASTIGYGAFMGCTNLKSVTIADSVSMIGEFAFNECHNLTKMVIKGENMPRISNELEYNAYSFTVVCKKGSEIENWANKRNLPVEYLSVQPRRLVGLILNEDYWHVGALASVTALYSGNSDIQSMEYTVYNAKGEVISTTAIIADTFSFVVPDYGSYVIRASMIAEGGEWHYVDSRTITVVKPVTPLRLIDFTTNVAELTVGEQLNFSLNYEGDDYGSVARMLFYTYDGNGQQLGDPWVSDGFINYYGFIPSVAGRYAIRVYMLTKDGGEQVVTSPFFQVKGKAAEAIALKGFTADRKELRVGELINFMLDYTGNDYDNVGWMKFYTYNSLGQEVGDPWTWNGFVGHYGFISSMPGDYAIRVFMATHDGGMQVVTSPFFSVTE